MKKATYLLFLVSLSFVACKENVDTSAAESTPQSIVTQGDSKKPTTQSDAKQVNPTNQKSHPMNRDQNIIGTWRHTEVISSGSGEFYASMATDDFIEFRADGSVATWVGTATAGDAGSTFESKGDTHAQIGLWNTNADHTQIIFTDPQTKQEARTNYYVEHPHLMFSNGNSKKVYERIR